ncbi:heat shock protein Hsp20 (plasmid) [Gemmatirosa kalamazoonensis]|uniref:Heat shock protein Hsp20 n=1 Tax=Gemmatirosa kalamazoonensis TaxID=861299 RepID=W0RNL7_9BACT|nr:Hsp20/alpha crystallin family protein [Gemmatirosa kalamazoonensis]AHG92604.1 heat shock protein Hsp20 [Gemmatirosa kalamazoonensis]
MKTRLLPRRLASRFHPSLGAELDRLDADIRGIFENPFRSMAQLFAEVPQPIGWMPPVEIAEDGDKLTISAELPGIDPANVHVELDGNLLTIRGEKEEEHTEDEKAKKFHVVERAYGTFLRSFTVPSNVDTAKVSATFEKGVLKVEMPTMKEARQRGREIAVTAK